MNFNKSDELEIKDSWYIIDYYIRVDGVDCGTMFNKYIRDLLF